MYDPNPLFDPENVPIMPEREQLSGLGERADINFLDLLAPLEPEKAEDVGEEPPWILEFMGQYRLVFGNSCAVTPAMRNDADASWIEKPQPHSGYPPAENLAFGNPAPVQSDHLHESESSTQDPVTDNKLVWLASWTWTHTTLAIGLVTLLGALVIMFLLPQRRPIEGKRLPLVPIVEPHFTNSKVANSVDSSELAAGAVSSEDAGSGIPIRKVLPVYPSAALARRLEGKVAVEAEITREGKVSSVTVLSGDPILARAAADAVRQWIYPSSTSEEADPRQQQVTIRFKAP